MRVKRTRTKHRRKRKTQRRAKRGGHVSGLKDWFNTLSKEKGNFRSKNLYKDL